MQTVRFEHRCADAEPHRVQAYAEMGSEDGRARALVLVYARRGLERGNDVHVGVRLVAMRLDAGRTGAKWSVRLEAGTASDRHIGHDHSHYVSFPARGEARRRPFRTNSDGVLDWLDYTEPFGGTGGCSYPCNWSPRMEAPAAALELTHESRNVALDLVLTEADGGNPVRLCGPTILVPDRIWYARPSNPANPDLLASLNPFAQGGLWQTLARATRSLECVRERRWAKRTFAVR